MRSDLHIKAHTNGWVGGILLEENHAAKGWNIHPDDSDDLMFGRNTNTAANPGAATHKLSIKSGGDLEIPDGDLVVASGHGINFYNYGTGTDIDSNLLDDYEEGSWTPALSNQGTMSYSHQIGRYTKIGRQVHFVAYVRWDSRSNDGSYNITYSGLPFNNANVGYLNPAIYVGGIEGLSGNNSSNTHMGGNVYNNSNTGQFRVSNTTGSGEISLHGGHGSTGAGYIYWGGSYYVT